MSTECAGLHEKFSKLPRFSHGYRKEHLPRNGIYILFENGETAHGTDRITRIGTHTGEGNLPKRIKEHIYATNKDRSIFRKHVGRCILAQRNDPFLQQWEIDLTTRRAREKYADKIDSAKQKKIEQEVSAYMRENMSFAVIAVEGKQQRLAREEQLISTIALCPDCSPSKNWLGLHHPTNHKIRRSGLWNVQGVPHLD